ncbi:transposase IS4 family protein [Marinomonas mediterranea MMB-1]|jgi:transposase, IS4 family|uniref:Transposase IS4 family protein n=1 Tax=Marinomonas mediterranea (strain ATCC 700492 / JCM 21426 / NBRC 103028 / MMB-1) TaxID=717774 RepID=F2JX56_MARM1|nr:transposase IS4 family protein [Marinomonas mediterranea MMB-1]
MKPRQTKAVPQKDLFQRQLVDIIDPNQPLVRLAKIIDWNLLDDELGVHFATVGAAVLPTRLMAGLLYLQHLHNLSDEMVLEQWLESPYHQYFCCEIFFRTTFRAIQR